MNLPGGWEAFRQSPGGRTLFFFFFFNRSPNLRSGGGGGGERGWEGSGRGARRRSPIPHERAAGRPAGGRGRCGGAAARALPSPGGGAGAARGGRARAGARRAGEARSGRARSALPQLVRSLAPSSLGSRGGSRRRRRRRRLGIRHGGGSEPGVDLLPAPLLDLRDHPGRPSLLHQVKSWGRRGGPEGAGGWRQRGASWVGASPAPSAPPAPPLKPRLGPFSHPCSEEAKSTTWLHPVTGEAVVTGHRRQSTGNAEPGRARAELAFAGRRLQSPGRPPPAGNLPRAAVPGRRRGGAEAGGRGRPQVEGPGDFPRVSGRPSPPSLIATSPRRPLPHPNLLFPHAPGWPTPLPRETWDPEFFLPRPLLSPPSAPRAPHLTPLSTFRKSFPTPLLQPETLPLVRGENVSTSSPSSPGAASLLLCGFLLRGGTCG